MLSLIVAGLVGQFAVSMEGPRGDAPEVFRFTMDDLGSEDRAIIADIRDRAERIRIDREDRGRERGARVVFAGAQAPEVIPPTPIYRAPAVQGFYSVPYGVAAGPAVPSVAPRSRARGGLFGGLFRRGSRATVCGPNGWF